MLDHLIRAGTQRWKSHRVVRTATYHVGEMLGDRSRVLIGEVPSGSRIALSSRDRQHRHIYWFREYEPEVTALLQQLLVPGATFFDVGANVGYFTLLARDLGASVHAFEPNPYARTLLQRSLAFAADRVVVVPSACSDRSGPMVLYHQDDSNSGMASVEKPTAVKIDITAVTLSEYWRSTNVAPDLIKIDVEGHEYKVLKGAQDLLDATHPALIVEVTEQRTLDLLRARGYIAHVCGASGPQAAVGQVSFAGGFVNMYFSTSV